MDWLKGSNSAMQARETLDMRWSSLAVKASNGQLS